MKKLTKNSKRKGNMRFAIIMLVWVVLVSVIITVLPSVPTNKISYGATVPFTPVPAHPNLQLEWFLVPTTSSTPFDNSQPGKPTQPNNPVVPIGATTTPSIGHFKPAPPGPTTPQSNGQPCPGGFDTGKPVTGACYCTALSVTCKNGVGYGADGKLYPGSNPCGTSIAPGSGRYCVEKPVIYLYPTVPTLVDVHVITSGKVVISDTTYPKDGWKQILADPNGTLHYNKTNYSELFYETSVTNFAQPQQGITLSADQLPAKLNTLLDQLGLNGHEKQEFLSFWLPRLEALHSPYVFFSVLPSSAKASIDTVVISPKPDTQIAFIAYFKPVAQPTPDTLQLPPTPHRHGFVSVEWGGVIGR